MSRIVALQMDPIESIRLETDTTYILGLEAQKRGYSLLHYHPSQLSLYNGTVVANASPLTLRRDENDYFTLGEPCQVELLDCDVVLLRQDPPFDMGYLTTTYLLEKIHPKTLVLNPPAEVRNAPEKLFVCDFKEFTPPTLISADRNAIADFHREYKKIILKPLYAFGGQDVFLIEDDLEEKIETLLSRYQVPLIAQMLIPGIAKGDKRIVLIDGEPVGALNRIPQAGNIRSNMAQGGTPIKTSLTTREHQICETLKPELQKRGLMLAGIDVIDGYLTEINVTSPTGLQVINRLDNVRLEEVFWDRVEKRYGL